MTPNPSALSRLIILALLLTVTAGAAPQAFAQDLGDIGSRARIDLSDIDPSRDLVDPAYAPASAGDNDMGVQVLLHREERYRPWRFRFDTGLFWTDNAALTEVLEVDDGYWRGTAGGSFLPKLGQDLYGEIFAQYTFYRYFDSQPLDFDDLDSGAGLIRVFRELGDLTLSAHYEYDRLIDAQSQTEIFTDNDFVFALYKPYHVHPGHLAYWQLRSEMSVHANPGVFRRHEHSALIGYRYDVSDRLNTEIFYRGRFLDYRNLTGDDWNHQLGAGFTFDFTDNLSFSGSYSIFVNDSSRPFGDYYAETAGGLLYLTIKM